MRWLPQGKTWDGDMRDSGGYLSRDHLGVSLLSWRAGPEFYPLSSVLPLNVMMDDVLSLRLKEDLVIDTV